MLRRVALVRTDVSEERIVFIIEAERICELGTSAVNSSLILSTLFMEVIPSPKRRF
jgi:tRNA threonylcarbamoyladenosine modification (KEOPS) complex  Pcc1 subunit